MGQQEYDYNMEEPRKHKDRTGLLVRTSVIAVIAAVLGITAAYTMNEPVPMQQEQVMAAATPVAPISDTAPVVDETGAPAASEQQQAVNTPAPRPVERTAPRRAAPTPAPQPMPAEPAFEPAPPPLPAPADPALSIPEIPATQPLPQG